MRQVFKPMGPVLQEVDISWNIGFFGLGYLYILFSSCYALKFHFEPFAHILEEIEMKKTRTTTFQPRFGYNGSPERFPSLEQDALTNIMKIAQPNNSIC